MRRRRDPQHLIQLGSLVLLPLALLAPRVHAQDAAGYSSPPVATEPLAEPPGCHYVDAVLLCPAEERAPKKPAVPLNEGPMTVDVTAGGQVSLTAGTSAVIPTGTVSVDGPLVLWRDGVAGRIHVEVGLGGAPGKAVNLVDVRTFRTGRVLVGLGRVIGRRKGDGQDVVTEIVGAVGFGLLQDSREAQPSERLARHIYGGIRVEERRSRASLTAGYGCDTAAGDCGYGHGFLSGQLPLPTIARRKLFRLTGAAVVPFEPFYRTEQPAAFKQTVSWSMGVVVAYTKKEPKP